ncbi:MAG: glycosyltransferase family 1 [Hyphococcus sp.]|nr:MAG: glycosyltransferase family 1 [Marinicaulis sp.]
MEDTGIPKKLRVVFALADRSIQANGGFRIIAGYSDYLQRNGYDVTLIAPGGKKRIFKPLLNKIKSVFGKSSALPPLNYERPFLEASDVTIKIVPDVGQLAREDFPDADIYIGTWWETVEWIENLPEEAAKCHFVQGYEVFPYLPVERVHDVYSSPIKKLVVSKWLQNKMQERYQATDTVLIENPIAFDQFYGGLREKPTTPRVGFLYSPSTFKNCALAIAAIKRLRSEIPNLEAVSFGSVPPAPEHVLGDGIEYILKPPQSEIPEIYRSCSVWLFTSENEGFGLPLLEAMACGAPVVATRAGAAPELVNASNGALVESDVESVADAAAKIINLSTDDWRVMSNKAVEVARDHDWSSAAAKFEAIIVEAVAAKQKS